MKKRFTYETCCVNSTAEAIHEMVDQATDVTYRTLANHCDITEFISDNGYERDVRRGLTLEKDWAVSYHKSVYKGRACYYIRHSGIEYIFTDQNGEGRDA